MYSVVLARVVENDQVSIRRGVCKQIKIRFPVEFRFHKIIHYYVEAEALFKCSLLNLKMEI